MSFLERNGIIKEQLKPSSRLCSLHFDSGDIIGKVRRQPVYNAFPKIDVVVVEVTEPNKQHIEEIEDGDVEVADVAVGKAQVWLSTNLLT